MNRLEDNHYQEALSLNKQKLSVVGKSILIGLLAGLIASVYRMALGGAEDFCFGLYGYFSEHPAMIPLLFLGLGAAGYLVGVLTDRYPMIRGSGIPQVKGEIMGHFEAPWLSTLAAKFLGGLISLAAGLSLGREGPSIQLGASVAKGLSEKWSASRTERRVMLAGGASAGLAAAFNAPLAGAMFAVEEIYKYISPLILMMTIVSAMVGDFVAKLIFGLSPVFSFDLPEIIPLNVYWLLIVLGLIVGAAGALYNVVLVKTQALYQAFRRLPARFRPLVPFLLAGVLGLVLPAALGGGHAMLEELNVHTGLGVLALLFVVKFFFSMVSFGSGAPGGIFFPLLILGGALGAIVAKAADYFGLDPALFNAFVVVAMAGYFSAIVRAPVTGVILLLEMTGSFVFLLPLIVVSFTAYLTAELMGVKPIYDSLLDGLLEKGNCPKCEDASRKIMIEMIVQSGAAAEGAVLKDLKLPPECLLIAVRRGEADLIPSGRTAIHAGDYLVFLVNEKDEAEDRNLLGRLVSESSAG